MSCSQTNYSPIYVGSTTGPHPPGAIIASDENVLVVSNAPETVTSAFLTEESRTLYKCAIPLKANVPLNIRIFFWHLNTSGIALDFQVRLSLDWNANGSASGRAQQEFPNQSAANLSVPGICMAKAQLYQTLDAVAGTLGLSSTEAVLWNTGTTANGNLAAAVLQFTVTATTDCSLQLRTLAAHGGSAGTWTDKPVSPTVGGITHVRGWWPRRAITLPWPQALNTNTDLPRFVLCGVNENPPGTPELTAAGFGWQGQTIDPHGTAKGNNGLYGANVTYRLTAYNDDIISAHAAYLSLVIRSNTDPVEDSVFFGACYVTSPGTYPHRGVPILRVHESATDPPVITHDWVDMTGQNPIIVPASGQVYVDVRIATAGAAALPINLRANNIAAVPP